MELSNQVQSSDSFNAFFNQTGTSGTLMDGAMTTGHGWYQPTYWYSYPENKTERAYSVIRALMRAKVVQIRTLNQFFETMDEVIKVI